MSNAQAPYDVAIARLTALLERARQTPLAEPTATALATLDARGRPTVRIVDVKAIAARGILFCTNSESQKGVHLAANPSAAMCFFWDCLGVQVRVEGAAIRCDEGESDRRWAARGRGRQLASYAFPQSRKLDNPGDLERLRDEAAARFEGQSVPRPHAWLAYVLVPERMEFWCEKPRRAHERTIYERTDAGWAVHSLFP